MKTRKQLLDLIQRQVSRTRMLQNRAKQEKSFHNTSKAFAGAPAEPAAPGEAGSHSPKKRAKARAKERKVTRTRTPRKRVRLGAR
eukprot:3018613-Lingulodinium_polyedra.AAC.1